MKELEGIVKFYLNNETNNALLITGEYGIGKTYYYKEILSKQIMQTETYHDASKNYKPILVSLFGLSNLEDIQTQIFVTLYPILDNKKVKIGAAIGKTLLKAIMNFKDWSDYYEIVSEAGINKKDLINFNDLVICFDDLERVSSNFQIEELIGFVNSLTEGNNAKIIIIANENQLEKEKFNHLKEKVIGNTIEYIPDIEKTYNSLIVEKYSGMPTYKKFLEEKKTYILKNFTPFTKNIRTLYFIFTYYHSIYSYLSLNAITHKFVDENLKTIFNLTLKFTITIALEFKKGDIKYSDKKEVDNSQIDISDISLNKISIKRYNQNSPSEENKSYKQTLIENYYADEQYVYFESIFDYITGGNILDEKLLLEELKTFYKVSNDVIPSHYKIYNKLNYPEVFNLNNTDYLKLTKELLKFSDEGLYNMSDYTTIFYFIARFNNPLKFSSLIDIEKRVIKGLRKGIKNYNYIPNINYFLTINPDAKFFDNYNNIKKVILDINDEKKKILDKIENERLQKLYSQDWESFQEYLLTKDYQPVLNFFDAKKFSRFYINAEISTKWKINSLLKHRYRQHMYEVLFDELPFLETIQLKIHEKLNRNYKNGLEFFVYDDFNNTLKDTINNIKNFKGN
ncbi:hypothetical protein [Chryseobacterium hagamense]|uniref:KAP NTPase domain-containing protein n=1 Tax=Chryseobacterium hagamense TaxID=395935 RepID=A0A511YQK6_9FLAO|nr:hypothetical protein [Chryseobacterium hagamense]GEN77469.1 hypothetical protein CHA01nite_32090 [Chryseobacterium hagamense]